MLDFDDAPGTPGLPWIPPKEREPPEMDHAPGWRPSAFTWKMGRLILMRLQDQETVKEITADPDMPSYATVYRWTHVVPEFGRMWRAVRAELAAEARRTDQQRKAGIAWRRAYERKRAGKAPRDWVSGRKSTYTLEMAHAICERLATGASLSEVVKTEGMPSFKAIYRWLKNEPEFAEMYTLACQARAEWLADQELEIAFAATEATARAAQRQILKVRGRAGRMAPRKYRG